MKLWRMTLILCLGLGIGFSACAQPTPPIDSSAPTETSSSQASQPEEAAPPAPSARAAWKGQEYVISEGAVLRYPTQESGKIVHTGDQVGDLVVTEAFTVYEAGAEDKDPIHIGVAFDGTITLTGAVISKAPLATGDTTVMILYFAPDLLSMRVLPRTEKAFASRIAVLLNPDPALHEIDSEVLKSGGDTNEYTRFQIVLSGLNTELVKDDNYFYAANIVSIEEQPVVSMPLRYIDDPLAMELTALADAYSVSSPVQGFTSAESLQHQFPFVTANLFRLAVHYNEELVARGSGVEKNELEAMGLPTYYPLVRHRDMDAIGKYFFGENFSLPEGEEFWVIEPYPSFPEFYQETFETGDTYRYNYIPVKITQDGADITLRLLLYAKRSYSGIPGMSRYVSGWDWLNPLGITHEIGYFDLTPKERNDLEERHETMLPFLYLTAPQEELMWYDLTFREEDGRYVFASCEVRKPPFALR